MQNGRVVFRQSASRERLSSLRQLKQLDFHLRANPSAPAGRGRGRRGPGARPRPIARRSRKLLSTFYAISFFRRRFLRLIILFKKPRRETNVRASYQKAGGHRRPFTLATTEESSVDCRLLDRYRINKRKCTDGKEWTEKGNGLMEGRSDNLKSHACPKILIHMDSTSFHCPFNHSTSTSERGGEPPYYHETARGLKKSELVHCLRVEIVGPTDDVSLTINSRHKFAVETVSWNFSRGVTFLNLQKVKKVKNGF
ncbi:hypothetical protein EVAR_7492_1 [Eumeta japonica]|uniref:Uncharacterized protein n=1 Tax=Eumeta variegata TaxID=151549 RepID=A0A4C1Y702_EUMVA|nr:hypothetical protein EVAR_7492_1 [Eumeta japonica]